MRKVVVERRMRFHQVDNPPSTNNEPEAGGAGSEGQAGAVCSQRAKNTVAVGGMVPAVLISL